MTTATRDAEYYLGLQYPIRLRRLRDEEGGGWVACRPRYVRTRTEDRPRPLQGVAHHPRTGEKKWLIDTESFPMEPCVTRWSPRAA